MGMEEIKNNAGEALGQIKFLLNRLWNIRKKYKFSKFKCIFCGYSKFTPSNCYYKIFVEYNHHETSAQNFACYAPAVNFCCDCCGYMYHFSSIFLEKQQNDV